MKLITYTHEGASKWGAVVGDGVIDLGTHLADIDGVAGLLGAGAQLLAAARSRVECSAADYPLSAVTLQRPIPQPRKIFCIGVNYAQRNAEYKDGSDLPKYPSIFMRVPDSFSAPDQALLQPHESQQLDYEGEIGIVIGQGGRRIPPAQALAHIGGLTCVNEGTIRDWVHHAKFNVTQGKNFHRSGSYGPWVVTADEFPDGYAGLHLSTRVNGELRQQDTTARLMFDFAQLIAYLSTFTTLETGDLIVTGTPTGAGIRFDPPRFLRPGDVVEVEVAGVGCLRNRVEAEQ
ncbi:MULTISPECIES: fumarylacetoacetate hydrolase family protein [unclassified Pseudomonas]|uniref:fumarylacetoacetate hydrolase family protein n=1 Tax=unclassified Pseudomonas TaxID=196821 RepID=UPI000BCC9435|nr:MULTISPECIES: fumarylacetoacetate hydrolase family protein [unclassified Pseudomonas]PVZ19709.1 2-keto-4-pentenoate hydratase/2-oxohepta-3-ene-1,7-dioic acid hydratase in catechol pathway [Pseudomonas sp. URIL14HWK12:I12]PVZ22706.1 2-keto-4-pentenoate hydratase/2-oxohepta-3-ene-1,7-dioic acid hydratase in catechol pathway [Pseudomonas sp. URIL14HWK12:I10]PVZ37664.1 2-keto-4-pentenoate hydratase/2-oxohepta-3-ene-1,7-dioic acid hydratase in catechol pathway [Pseudomonas sp. URIL14HWK12:I11]SNZ